MTIIEQLARELNRPAEHIENVVRLLDEGNTIPFIARYRKELHGSMDDTALRTLEERLAYLRNLTERKESVKASIAEQEKLTDELAAAIDAAQTLAEVEDLYRPYKPKRRTRATVAKEKGLEPLAALLFAQERDCPKPEDAAADYLSAEKGVETVADALQGANDIVAEWISDDAAIRRSLRELLEKRGTLRSLAATEEDSVYRLYYDFEQPLSRLQGHQILAINRGEKEKMLSATVLLDRELALPLLRRAVVKPGSAAMEFVKAAAEDAYDRLIYPSLEREMRAALTDKASEGAIKMFALNLKPLLMQPPVKGHVTMGLDPGYAHGWAERVTLRTGDLRENTALPAAGSMDYALSNPPYFPAGSGASAAGEARQAAREEVGCTLADVCAAAARVLRWGGRFALVHRPERLSDLFCTLRAHGLEPKRLRFVASSTENAPSLALVEARRGGKAGLSIEPMLFIGSADWDEVYFRT